MVETIEMRHRHRLHQLKISGWGKSEKQTRFPPARLAAVVLKVAWVSFLACRLNFSCRGEAANRSHWRLQQRQQAQASRRRRSEKPKRFPLPRLGNNVLNLSLALLHRRSPVDLRPAVNPLARNPVTEVSQWNSATPSRVERSRGSTPRAMRHG